jgi:hypothetical protein
MLPVAAVDEPVSLQLLRQKKSNSAQVQNKVDFMILKI